MLTTIEASKGWGIAITGGIACGKSFISQSLREKGFPVFDADVFSKEVYLPGHKAYEEILQIFGQEILKKDLSIDRRQLAQIVFNDSLKKSALESIVHPEIERRLSEELENRGLLKEPRIWFYEASLIFERSREKDFKEVWLVTCDKEEQKKRLKKRNPGLSYEFIDSLLKAQLPFKDKEKRATFIIRTDGGKKEVLKELDRCLQRVQENF